MIYINASVKSSSIAVFSVFLLSACSVTGKKFDSLVKEGEYNNAILLQSEETDYFKDKKSHDKHKESLELVADYYRGEYRKSVSEADSGALKNATVNSLKPNQWRPVKDAITNMAGYFKKESEPFRQFRERNADLLSMISSDHAMLYGGGLCKKLLTQAEEELQTYDLLRDPNFFTVYPDCHAIGDTRTSSNRSTGSRSNLISTAIDGEDSPFSRASANHLIEFQKKYRAELSNNTNQEVARRIYTELVDEKRELKGQNTPVEMIASAKEAGQYGFKSELVYSQMPVYFLSNDEYFDIKPRGSTFKVTELTKERLKQMISGSNNRGALFVLPLTKKIDFEEKKPALVNSEYQSGSRMVSNPDYDEARRRVRDAEDSVQSAKDSYRFARQQAEERQRQLNAAVSRGTTSSNSALNLSLLNALVPTIGSSGVTTAENSLRDAEQLLSETPTEIQKDTFKKYRYQVQNPVAEKKFELYVAVYNDDTDSFELFVNHFKAQNSLRIATGRHPEDKTGKKYDDVREINEWLGEPHIVNLDSELPKTIAAERFVDAGVQAADLIELIDIGTQ